MGARNYLGHRTVGQMDRGGIPTENVVNIVIQDANNITGRHMNTSSKNLDDATAAFEQSRKNILKASDELHAQMDSLSKKAKDSVGRAKDQAAQMADAMNKISKIVGPDFESRMLQLQQLTDCLERLSKLNEAGKLAPVIAALNQKP